jgi:hypothetical protein
MFHIELRQFPHSTRAFNLSREALYGRIVEPWLAGTEVELEDRRWSPQKAKLTIYDGPALRPEDIGLGRGWANVTRTGEEVTAQVLDGGRGPSSAPGVVEEFKNRVVDRCEGERVPLEEIMALAGELHPDRRPSERLDLCERAVWELLHQRRLRMLSSDGAIDKDQWQGVVLGWSSWTGTGPWQPLLEAI